MGSRSRHVVVIVLGDLGRSPRMQYHAQSLAKLEEVGRVTLVGYEGEKCMEGTRTGKMVEERLKIPDLGPLRRLSLVHAIVKGLHILLGIFGLLMRLPHYDVVLIQNPPALPALAATLLVELFVFLHRVPASVIIDWHNLGFTMFEEREGKSTVAELSKLLEKNFATLCAHGHFCVSEAMRRWLKSEFGIDAVVLYDRPNSSFSTEPPSVAARHALLSKLGFTPELLFGDDSEMSINNSDGNIIVRTVHTRQTLVADPDFGMVGGEPVMLPTQVSAQKRRGNALSPEFVPIVISSTSWTPDEDFGILLNGLLDLNRRLLQAGGGRRVLVVVTGKGPTKAAFLHQIEELSKPQEGKASKLSNIAVRTVWLEPHEYPLMMRCADIGVCLHTSTSGLDLPMKVLDMFGSGMPVVAVSFPTLPELVRHGQNGFIFEPTKPSQLAAHLFELLSNGDPSAKYPSDQLLSMRREAGQLSDWQSNWLLSLQKPFIDRFLRGESRSWTDQGAGIVCFRAAFQLVLLYTLVRATSYCISIVSNWPTL